MKKVIYYFFVYSVGIFGIMSPLSAMLENFNPQRQLPGLLRPLFRENPLPIHGSTYAHTDFIVDLATRAQCDPSFIFTEVTPQQVSFYCKFFIQHNDRTRKRNGEFLARCITCLENSRTLSLEEARFLIELIGELKQFPSKEAASFDQRETCLRNITPYISAIYEKREELAALAAAVVTEEDGDAAARAEASRQEEEDPIESDSNEEETTSLHNTVRRRHQKAAPQHQRKKNYRPIRAPYLQEDGSDSDHEDCCSCLCRLLRRCCR